MREILERKKNALEPHVRRNFEEYDRYIQLLIEEEGEKTEATIKFQSKPEDWNEND